MTGLRIAQCRGAHAWLATLVLGACAAAPSPRGTCLYPWPTDVPQQKAVEANGECLTADDVVLWMPRGVVAEGDQRAWLARVAKGVRAAKVFVGRPDWNFRGDPKVYFYFADAQFLCHAPPGNVVFVPLWRMREDQAPWMHETMHILLASRRGEWFAETEAVQNARMPLWLHEGLAESLAIDIDDRAQLPHYSPLIQVPASGIDTLCRERLDTGSAAQVLAFVGARGKPPELFTEERMKVAPAFYAASTSFVRHLQRRYGPSVLLQAIEHHDDENEYLERTIGMPLKVAKEAWLDDIGYRGPR